MLHGWLGKETVWEAVRQLEITAQDQQWERRRKPGCGKAELERAHHVADPRDQKDSHFHSGEMESSGSTLDRASSQPDLYIWRTTWEHFVRWRRRDEMEQNLDCGEHGARCMSQRWRGERGHVRTRQRIWWGSDVASGGQQQTACEGGCKTVSLQRRTQAWRELQGWTWTCCLKCVLLTLMEMSERTRRLDNSRKVSLGSYFCQMRQENWVYSLIGD